MPTRLHPSCTDWGTRHRDRCGEQRPPVAEWFGTDGNDSIGERVSCPSFDLRVEWLPAVPFRPCRSQPRLPADCDIGSRFCFFSFEVGIVALTPSLPFSKMKTLLA